MHMNSAPHLLNEDREEFRRALDEALRTAADRPDFAATGMRLNTEQLRTMALSATTAIAACATAEYQHYVALRAELRAPASARPATAGTEPGEGGGDGAGGTGVGFATVGEVAEATGAGLAAMVTVLAPVLAGIAAVLFLLIGYVLHTVSPDEPLAQPLISVGWVFAALTAATILIAMGGLVVTALRNGATSLRASHPTELAQEVERAKTRWLEALQERGLKPFLLEALTAPEPPPEPDIRKEEKGAAVPASTVVAAEPTVTDSPATVQEHASDPAGAGEATGPASGEGQSPPPAEAAGRYVAHRTPDSGRMPTLGYTHPRFSGPEDDHRTTTRPRFTSPDFTSPDYGGPDHQPE
ncbi:hypothetical protein CCS38_21535 [Streptomyces purpurogeneiscleroticus]|nr:hypothetical protein [Streptomyces purpurogeneiscleroticus]MBZ4018267.1 hypothetical protein [Streptomyces purpurogeneiscleroticus]